MLRQTGISLIELLTSLMLISILLLGVDAVLVTSIQQSRSVYYFAAAQQQINVISEKLKLIKNNQYQALLNAWNKQNQEVLPQGRGTIKGSDPNETVSIFWGNTQEQDCEKNKIGTEGCLRQFIA
ncbi:MAG: hypothetical protein KIT56_07515 [Gammaproteobacteria bacterium]|nr:hypothetical protein [Gammaproteobacteria bacterium]MCW5583708.1 hypothetical protein [Gammaproteobacteria bacterium]